MKIRHVQIENFRGIESLSWLLGGDFLCLIGPGDSGKSTVLDAVELALSPKWAVQFDDSDFFKSDTSKPIVIDITVGALPAPMLSDARFGMRLRGLADDGILHDEPIDDTEPVLTIRLCVDSSLEPKWHVHRDDEDGDAPINARERERFGVARLGSVVDWHLTWSRGSILSRFTGEIETHAEVLADASRAARSSVTPNSFGKLVEVARRVAEVASSFGVNREASYVPHIDARSAALGVGGLALHDGAVPLRRAGLGTRRLLATTMQHQLLEDGGVTLIDEVEHGLEPHRVRRLVASLRVPAIRVGTGSAPTAVGGTVLMSSHSPTVLSELGVSHVRVVRRDRGVVRIRRISAELGAALHLNPDALLARRVIACEGKTELGFCRGLDSLWSEVAVPFAFRGAVLVNGGGCTLVAERAMELAALGYDVAVLADSDEPLSRSAEEFAAAGIEALIWDGSVCIEQRLAQDLPWVGVVEMIKHAADRIGDGLVRAQVATSLQVSPASLAADYTDWCANDEALMRAAVGKAAKNKTKPWFKEVVLGEQLGALAARYIDEVPLTNLATTVGRLCDWVHRDQD